MAQGTCQPGFADTAGAGDYQVSAISDPFSGQKLLEQGFIETPGGAVIHILWHGTDMAQLGGAHTSLEPLVPPAGNLTVNEQAEPFGMAQRRCRVLCLKFGER